MFILKVQDIPPYQTPVILEIAAAFSPVRQLFEYHDIVSYIIYCLLEVTVLL
jgi:hypothetical protein